MPAAPRARNPIWIALACLTLACGAAGSPAADPAAGADVAVDAAAPDLDAAAAAETAAATDGDGTAGPVSDGELADAADAAVDVIATAADGDADAGQTDADAAPAGDGVATDGAPTTDATGPDVLVVPPDSPAGTNLYVQVTPKVDKLQGYLMLKLVEAAFIAQGDFQGGPADQVLYEGPLALPLEAWFAVPPGEWVVAAMVMDGGQFVAGGLSCADGDLQVLEVTAGGPPQAAQVAVGPVVEGAPQQACSDKGAPAQAKGVLTTALEVKTPPTQWGGAHFMQGLVWDERFWIAGSQDGFVSFDFPPQPPSPPKPLSNWQVHGGPMCNRAERVGSTLFCSSRASYLHVLQVDPNTLTKQGLQKVELDQQVGTEGLAARGSLLYVAVHGKGLVAVDLSPPYGKLPLQSPPQLTDTWDVRPLGPDHLAVADGKNGLVILDVVAGKPLAPLVVATLPLPGRAAFLHVHDTLVIVGALGGGLHVVDASQPAKPVLLSSLAVPGVVYGVTVHGDLVVAAAGHHVLAADLPKPGQPGPLVVRGATESHYYALDVDPFGSEVLAAEFQAVRRIQVAPDVKQGPVLLAPMRVFGRVTKVGDTLTAELRLTNLGTAPLQIDKVAVMETVSKAFLPGTWTLQPGETTAILISMPKTAKGVLQHFVYLYTNDPTAKELVLDLQEVAWLRPGDALPPLQYQDGAGKTWNVAQHFAGKPGVVLAAAQSCPVAFMGLASAGVDLLPLLQSDQIAAIAINPWDQPNSAIETKVLDLPYPVVYSPLTTSDGHDWSEILDVTLGQPIVFGPPMPIVYVVDKTGKILLAQWGWEREPVLAALQQALAP